jgi:hypothetical protein
MTDKTNIEWASELLQKLTVETIPECDLLAHSLSLSGEAAITMFLKWALEVGAWKSVMASAYRSAVDTVVFHYQLRIGTADIVIFHADGSATVVKVKDGSQGFGSVIGGLGEAGLHAAQIGQGKALTEVRRALAWTAIKEPAGVDQIVAHLCKEAGVIPVFLPRLENVGKAVIKQQVETIAEIVRDFANARSERV